MFAFDGKVVNPQGKPIIGASVLLLNADSTIANTAITDTLGQYRMVSMLKHLHNA